MVVYKSKKVNGQTVNYGENYLWGLLSCSFGCRTLVTFSLPGWFVFLHCWSTHLSSFFVGLVGLDIVRVQMWRLLSLWNDLFSPASTFNALINVESITMHYALSRIFNFIHFPIKTKKAISWQNLVRVLRHLVHPQTQIGCEKFILGFQILLPSIS